jgi:XTP/dITP diphosphohydrolase
MNTISQKLAAFERLLQIMDDLREKCPWDKKQTIDSLRHLTIEEMYELAEAIIKKDMPEIKKELGDILLHIVFYARIASETGDFDMADVINALCEKLIHRHPHIYGDTVATTEEQVKENWEKLKLKEGNKSILGGVPSALPALVKAYRIQDKAKAVGFEWENKEQVWAKVEEELIEFKEEVVEGNRDKIEDEYGDLLFSLVNYGRFIGVNPEDALERTNQKFISRFKYIEDEAKNIGKKLEDMTLEEMDKLWNQAKRK